MIYLGNYHRDRLNEIVRRATRALRDDGEIALFIGKNGECAAYPHFHERYERHIRVHANNLVGIYRNSEACDRVSRLLYDQIDEDVQLHIMGQIKAQVAA